MLHSFAVNLGVDEFLLVWNVPENLFLVVYNGESYGEQWILLQLKRWSQYFLWDFALNCCRRLKQ